MNLRNLTRTGTGLAASAALFASLASGAFATSTFNVSTTITNSCTVTDSGPADLFPQYTPSSNTGVGSATTLNTFCNGTNPGVSFSDGGPFATTQFTMTNGGTNLYFQISNNTTCDGSAGDNPVLQGLEVPLGLGASSFSICAAVVTNGGINVGVPAGSYTDTVTYTIVP